MLHYSSRLGRNFRPDDDLFSAEVGQVMAENAGYAGVVNVKYVSSIAQRDTIPRTKVGNIYLYKYRDVRNLKYQLVGRPAGEKPNSNAQRQRRFKARKRAQAEESGDHRPELVVASEE